MISGAHSSVACCSLLGRQFASQRISLQAFRETKHCVLLVATKKRRPSKRRATVAFAVINYDYFARIHFWFAVSLSANRKSLRNADEPKTICDSKTLCFALSCARIHQFEFVAAPLCSCGALQRLQSLAKRQTQTRAALTASTDREH